MNATHVPTVRHQFDSTRLDFGRSTAREHKRALGQFLTPFPIANFMASLFRGLKREHAHLLDPGAGVGSLSGAFIERWKAGRLPLSNLEVTAIEIDSRLNEQLQENLNYLRDTDHLRIHVSTDEFIQYAAYSLLGFDNRHARYTHAILNPPYKKISSSSQHRQLLRKAGMETVNLYSGFVGLALKLLQDHGELVAIIPRSFCNGPYYKGFRDLILDNAAIHQIHLFNSRTSAFKDDAVLQENVIIHLGKGAAQHGVIISTSGDDSFSDFEQFEVPFESIVRPGDTERFIHIPLASTDSRVESSSAIQHSLKDLRIEVSTGPVVDFRMRKSLRQLPEDGTVPLLYPCHFGAEGIIWPRLDQKKPNALLRNSETEKWLYPTGFYAVVRRFSSKEEARRIVASLVNPEAFQTTALGFENHLNVFHSGKNGLDEDTARGLCVFLNSTAVDQHFRRFNGHTQVNATDLRKIKYPSLSSLKKLGRWSRLHPVNTQHQIDEEIERIA